MLTFNGGLLFCPCQEKTYDHQQYTYHQNSTCDHYYHHYHHYQHHPSTALDAIAAEGESEGNTAVPPGFSFWAMAAFVVEEPQPATMTPASSIISSSPS